MINASSNEQFISVCCIPDELDPADSFCYRNGSFPIWEIFTTIVSNFSIAFVPVRSQELKCNETSFELAYYPPNNDVFYLREDGSIYVFKSMYGSVTDYVLDISDYCFTSRLTENGRKGTISVCVEVDEVYGVGQALLIPRIAAGLSLPFLAATFLMYTILPELNNVPGFTLRACIASLFVTWTLFLIINENSQFACSYFIVPVMYFSSMAYYIWVTVMCFDIWWTFRRVRSSRSQSKQYNRKKCVIYSISAWGTSAFITGVEVIIDSVPALPKGVIRPGLHDSCGVFDTLPFMIYWIGPISLTVICDICFFVLTAIILIQHEKNMAHTLHGNDDQLYKNDKKRFHLYLKLFVVMGIANVADVINLLWKDKFSDLIGILLDLPSSLQGVSIFVIFACKKKTRELFCQRLRRRDNPVPPKVV